MITYKVSIPDDKQSFFQEFLDMLGVSYEKSKRDWLLSDEQKEMLDQRLEQPKENFKPAEEALNKLREKYGL